MQSLSEIRALLAERGLRPKQRLGQHFLHDKNHLARLLEEAQIEPGELVLEVGPGTGTLTEGLLEREAQIVVCEVDRDLAALVVDRFGNQVRLVQGDCLTGHRALNPALVAALDGRPFKLVANLPFQVASTLIVVLLLDQPACQAQFVTIQKEVADRLRARPGSKAYGAVGIIVQALAEVGQISVIPPSCFWPVPAVSSAMFRVRPRSNHGIDDPHGFAAFVTKLFTARRKKLSGIVGQPIRPWPDGISPDLRPDALTVAQMVALWKTFEP